MQNNGINLLKFDLTAAEMAPRKNIEDEKFAHVKPEEWDGTFGVSLASHEKAVTMPTFLEDTTIIISGDNDEEA